MAATDEIRYVALKPLLLQTDEGERLQLAPGEEVPAVVKGRWVHIAVESGKLAALPSLSLLTDGELAAELEERGYKVAKARKAA